jgi:2-polyprenyl-6-methoxyphenol hydroxylase-like FAD-dependent oxidoreductase
MKKLSVLISGAGIAGPAAAFWLQRAGFDTTVVECWPSLRQGGQAVDFRGPVHREILQRMGIWDAIHEQQTHLGDHVMLDPQGSPCATMPSLMFSGEVEILRGDLSQILYDRTHERTEYIFGDTLVGLEERESGVRARFERSKPRTFDLVIGADGLHSRVRTLTFGDEQQFLRHHGYRVAGFTLPNILGLKRTAQTYSEAGGVRAILEHLGLPTAGVRLAPAREPPQAAGC